MNLILYFGTATLGVVENELYEGGSDALVNLLTRSNKQINYWWR